MNKTLSPAAQALWDEAMQQALGYGEVKNETIASPGKFEGEWFPVVYFYRQAMDGMANESGDGVDTFFMTLEETEAFGGTLARLHYSDQGFIALEITNETATS